MTTVLAYGKPLSKAQLSFQQLVGRIEVKREQLKQWQAYLTRYNQRLASEMEPVLVKLRAGKRQMIEVIDELLSRPAPGRRLTRLQRAKLEQLILPLIIGLLNDGDDEGLEALHDKYSDVSRAQIKKSEKEITEAMLNDVLGLDLDESASSAEDVLENARKLMQERIDEEARLADEWQNERAARRSRASPAKVDAAQARRDEAAREISQSLREVYRKLASALHPDREPDAEARRRKTLLMQRVNQAYADNDLLTLLGLQLEIEQIDAAQLASIPPQRLAHYNQILREQLADLESELERCIEPFRFASGHRRNLTPAILDRHLSADIEAVRADVRELQKDVVAIRDPDELRDMLKQYRLEEDFHDHDEFADMMVIFEAPTTARRGKKRRRG